MTTPRTRQWERQINLFKNTDAYKTYRDNISKTQRRKQHLPTSPRVSTEGAWTPSDPVLTPNTSKRSGDGVIRLWKREISQWYNAHPEYHVFIPHQYDFDDSKCEWCGEKAKSKCPCFRVGYCSTECQEKSWPNHKFTCTYESTSSTCK